MENKIVISDKINFDQNKHGYIDYINKLSTPDKNIDTYDFTKQEYNWGLYIKNEEYGFAAGTLIVAETMDNEIIYYDEFVTVVKEKYKNKIKYDRI